MEKFNDTYFEPIIWPFCKKNCIFCCEWWFWKRKFISLENFKKEINKHNITKVYLSWWEPLLNPKILEYISYCKSKNIYVWLVTAWDPTKNETFSLELYKAWLTEIMFSLEWPQKIHNMLIRDPNAYQNILKVLYFIWKHNINFKVTLASNFNAINYKYLPKFFEKILHHFPFISLIKLQFLRGEWLSQTYFQFLMLPYSKLITPFLNYNYSKDILKKFVFVETPFCILWEKLESVCGKNTNFLRDFSLEKSIFWEKVLLWIQKVDRSFWRFFWEKCSNCLKKEICPWFDPYYIKFFWEVWIIPIQK